MRVLWLTAYPFDSRQTPSVLYAPEKFEENIPLRAIVIAGR
jgi:hypothetical protein